MSVPKSLKLCVNCMMKKFLFFACYGFVTGFGMNVVKEKNVHDKDHPVEIENPTPRLAVPVLGYRTTTPVEIGAQLSAPQTDSKRSLLGGGTTDAEMQSGTNVEVN